MIQLRKDEHKVKKIYIDGNFMRRMKKLGYNTEATIKDGKEIRRLVEKIQIIHEKLKEKVQQHKASNIKNKQNYICPILVRVKNDLEKAILIELHNDPVDDIDPHDWLEKEVTIKWEKSGNIERLPMNRVKKLIQQEEG